MVQREVCVTVGESGVGHCGNSRTQTKTEKETLERSGRVAPEPGRTDVALELGDAWRLALCWGEWGGQWGHHPWSVEGGQCW